MLDAAILDWCDDAPAVRYPTMAKVAPLFAGDGDAGGLQLSSLIRALPARSPATAEVLQTIISRVHTPHSWSGSFANVLETRLKLLQTLGIGSQPDLVRMLNEAKSNLASWIESARRTEADGASRFGGGFE